VTRAIRLGPEHFEDTFRDDDLAALRTDSRFAGAVKEALLASRARESAAALDQRLLLPIDQMDLTMRVLSGLERMGFELVGDLVQKSVGEIASQMGTNAVNEIQHALRELKLGLGTPVSDWQAARAWWRVQRRV
jgi:DNA-directed RNA polymerase alpha subunit